MDLILLPSSDWHITKNIMYSSMNLFFSFAVHLNQSVLDGAFRVWILLYISSQFKKWIVFYWQVLKSPQWLAFYLIFTKATMPLWFLSFYTKTKDKLLTSYQITIVYTTRGYSI